MVSEEPNSTVAPTASRMARMGSSEDMGAYSERHISPGAISLQR
jgi:hypothetical protein